MLVDCYKNKVADISIGLVAEMAQIEIKPFQKCLNGCMVFPAAINGAPAIFRQLFSDEWQQHVIEKSYHYA
jgi:hypothetical protein